MDGMALLDVHSGGATTTTVAGAQPPREVAYGDVLDAWKQYLANDNDGRPFVLVGHSQGAGHLLRLIREQIDDNAALRAQMVSAMLIGGGVPQPGTTGALVNVPPCERAAPVLKSTWPPNPEKNLVPIESAHTWPVRSISSATLIATILCCWLMIYGLFTYSVGWNENDGLSSRNS